MEMEEIRQKINHGNASLKDFQIYAEKNEVDINTAFDIITLICAREFLDEKLSFDDADSMINSIWWLMCDYASKSNTKLAVTAYSIYEAFDAGEGPIKESGDPVKINTIPMLEQLLARLNP
jgi:hypothetical protein